MAETIKQETVKPATKNAKRVEVKLPRNPGQNANQDEFFSVNFKNYIIQRGEYVEVPKELAKLKCPKYYFNYNYVQYLISEEEALHIAREFTKLAENRRNSNENLL